VLERADLANGTADCGEELEGFYNSCVQINARYGVSPTELARKVANEGGNKDCASEGRASA
jgi:hypothetical protein